MASIDYSQLTSDLLAARRIAAVVASDSDDGGTCNLDTLAIAVGKGQMFGRFSQKLANAFEEAGLELENDKFRGTIIFSLNVSMGQANSRNRGITAARKFLQAQGWPITMWFFID